MLTLAAGLQDGYEVSFVCPATTGGRSLLARARALGIETFALDIEDADRVGSPLMQWLRVRRIEIFHCHAGIAWEGHGGVYAARVAGVPVVFRTEHLPYFLLGDAAGRRHHGYLVEELDCLIGVSEAVGESFRAVVPREKLCVVRNGIALDSRHAASPNIPVGLGLPAGSRVVLTVARLTEQKSHRDLLAAVPLVCARVPDAHFLWVGDGPMAVELRAWAQALGVAAHVHFLGGRRDVPELLAAAQLFVLASRFEGLPLALLEAMAAGLPAVGTNVCGIAEVIADGTTGRLVEAGAVRGMAAAITELLEQPDLAQQWGAAGRSHVEREFTAARMVRETVALYEAMRGRQGRAQEQTVGTALASMHVAQTVPSA